MQEKSGLKVENEEIKLSVFVEGMIMQKSLKSLQNDYCN